MTTGYTHFTSSERAELMALLTAGHSQSEAARRLGRNRSSISRELGRNGARLDRDTGHGRTYDATSAQARADRLAHAPGPRKLAPDTALFAVVESHLRKGWSPEQIAGVLKREHPDHPAQTVCHETIYTALYVLPRGSLRSELLTLLRQARGKRRPRARGSDRRFSIPDLVSIALRPPEADDRRVPGHWEGDLIKGQGNRSCVGTLVERSSRLVILARTENATAEAGLAGFTAALKRVPEPLRKTLAYDRGKEMKRHSELAAATGIAVYFADPSSPWQRGTNENTNGLLREYLPKGTDLSGLTQDDLDAIALRLNTRPRKIHGFRSPLEVFADYQAKSIVVD